MPLSESMAAYEDCYSLYDRARADGNGIRALVVGGKDYAGMMRMRMNKARALERAESKRLYDKHDPRWGKSENDKFRVTMREDTEGNWWVYVERWDQAVAAIEPLSGELVSEI